MTSDERIRRVATILDRFTASTGIDVFVRHGGSATLEAILPEEGEHSPAVLLLVAAHHLAIGWIEPAVTSFQPFPAAS